MIVTDPITGERRLLEPGRAARVGEADGDCPFCAGAEHLTTGETMRVPSAGSQEGARGEAGWRARSFPNRYPLSKHHEVVVAAPRHATSWRDLDDGELLAATTVLLARRGAITAAAPAGSYVHAFLNDGIEAGGSMPHVHAQVVALPAGERSSALTRHTGPGDGCAICSIAARRDLVVRAESATFVAAHPAPRMGGSLVAASLSHSSFNPSTLAEALGWSLRALEPGPCNAWLVDGGDGHHAWLELVPRTAQLASVELALGLPISVMTPGDAHSRARERLGVPSAPASAT